MWWFDPREHVIDRVITHVHGLVRSRLRHLPYAFEELRPRLRHVPLGEGDHEVGRKIQAAQQFTRACLLIPGDDHTPPLPAQLGQGGPDVVVEIALLQLLPAPGSFACLVLGGDIDAGADQPQRFGVVLAPGDDSADERRERVTGDAQPVRPGCPVTVVSGDGLADVEHDLGARGAARRAVGLRTARRTRMPSASCLNLLSALSRCGAAGLRA